MKNKMEITISSYNNHIPKRDGNVSFSEWTNEYKRHIRFIFEIFRRELPEIKDTRENYIKLSKSLYKYSSRVNIS